MLEKEASHPGEWSEAGSPTKDPIDNIEWKAKPQVNQKADSLPMERAALLRMEQVGRVREPNDLPFSELCH